MLFHKRTKSILRVFWTIIAVLVGLSMIFLYAPIFTRSTPRGAPRAVPEPVPLAPGQSAPQGLDSPTFSPALTPAPEE